MDGWNIGSRTSAESKHVLHPGTHGTHTFDLNGPAFSGTGLYVLSFLLVFCLVSLSIEEALACKINGSFFWFAKKIEKLKITGSLIY